MPNITTYLDLFNVDDYASVSDAISALDSNGGGILYFGDATYTLTGGNIAIPSNCVVTSHRNATIQVDDSTLNPLFTVAGTKSNIAFLGLNLVGNSDTQTSAISGSAAVSVSSGAANIVVERCTLTNWTQHAITLDGVTNARIERCDINQTYHGAGVMCSTSNDSTNIHILHNRIRNTQLANIQSYQGIDGWYVLNNHLDTTNAGSGDTSTGKVADNITCYPTDLGLTNAKIIGNTCKNSGAHGIHVGGIGIEISGNDIIDAAQIGILITAGGTSDWPDAGQRRIIVNGNNLYTSDNTNTSNIAIAVRNASCFAISNNTIASYYNGIEVRFIDDTPATGLFTEVGIINNNTLYDIYKYGIELESYVKNTVVFGNSINVSDVGGQHIIFNTDVSIDIADNIVAHNKYSGSGSQPRSIELRYGTSSVPPAVAVQAAAATASISMLAKGYGIAGLGSFNGIAIGGYAPTANTVNMLLAVGGAAGTAAALQAYGTDTNLDLPLTPKGTGKVKFGSHSAIAAETVTGYITIKDSGGTERKIAVVS